MDQLTKEAVRYLGYGRNAVDDQTRTMIAESFEILQSIAGRKSIYRIFCLEHLGDNRISFGNLEVQSKSLAKNLKGCDKIVVFGATLGIGVDQLQIWQKQLFFKLVRRHCWKSTAMTVRKKLQCRCEKKDII